MGLLDYLAQKQQERQVNTATALQKALAPLEDQRAADLRKAMQAEQDQQTQQAGVGVAQQLNRAGLMNDPTAQQAVGLMQNPGSRAAGLQLALARLDPQAQANLAQTQQQTATSAQQQANAVQGYDQAKQLFPLQIQEAKTQIAQNLAAVRSSGMSGSAQQLTFYNTVRGQYQGLPAIKMLGEAQSAYKQALGAVQQGSALGARVAMIKLAKLADPTSVVREGEVENIRQGYGALSQLDTALRAAGDKGLGPQQTQMFLDVMDSLYAPALELGAAATQQYRNLETQYQARPGEFTNSTGLDWGLVPGAWRAKQANRGKIQRKPYAP